MLVKIGVPGAKIGGFENKVGAYGALFWGSEAIIRALGQGWGLKGKDLGFCGKVWGL